MGYRTYLILGISMLVPGLIMAAIALFGAFANFTDILTADICLILAEVCIGLIIGGAILLSEAKKKQEKDE